MAVISLETFSLREGVSREEFIATDEALLQWRYVNRPGLLRRTTASGLDGLWLVDTWWQAIEHVHVIETTGPLSSWRALIDDASYQRQIFSPLD